MKGQASLFLLVLYVSVGCGGPEDGELFSGGLGGASSQDASTGSGGTAGASLGGSGGQAGVAGSAGSTGSGGLAGAATGGASATDAGEDAAGGSGAGPNAVGTGACGKELCSFELGASCCQSSSKGLYCSNQALGNPCSCSGILCESLEIDCDGPEDCASGMVCCATMSLTSGRYDEVSCRESCNSGISQRRALCHADAPICPDAQQCKPDPLLPPGYSTCQG
jgi:hypothetical protein